MALGSKRSDPAKEHAAGTPNTALPSASPGPFDDVRARGCRLVLPPRSFRPMSQNEPVELAKLNVNPQKCELQLIGSEAVTQPNSGACFKTNVIDEGGSSPHRTWRVGLTLKGNEVARPQDVGTFRLADGSLTFQWKSPPSDSTHLKRLQFCVLRIGGPGGKVDCVLCEPREIDAVGIDATSDRPRVPLVGDWKDLPAREHLFFDMELTGLEGYRITRPCQRAKVDELANMSLSEVAPGKANGQNRPILSIDVKVTSFDKLPAIEVALATPTKFVPRICAEEPQGATSVPVSTASIEQWIVRCENQRKDRETKIKELKKNIDELRKSTSDEDKESVRIMLENRGTSEREMADADAGCQWCKKMKDMLTQIKKKGRLHLRAYIVIEDTQVELVRTKGFPKAERNMGKRH